MGTEPLTPEQRKKRKAAIKKAWSNPPVDKQVKGPARKK